MILGEMKASQRRICRVPALSFNAEPRGGEDEERLLADIVKLTMQFCSPGSERLSFSSSLLDGSDEPETR